MSQPETKILEDLKGDEPIKDDRIWHFCCSKSEPHAIKYAVQVTFAAAVIIFSMAQIFINPVSNNEIHYSLISSTVAYFLPNPTLKDNKK